MRLSRRIVMLISSMFILMTGETCSASLLGDNCKKWLGIVTGSITGKLPSKDIYSEALSIIETNLIRGIPAHISDHSNPESPNLRETARRAVSQLMNDLKNKIPFFDRNRLFKSFKNIPEGDIRWNFLFGEAQDPRFTSRILTESRRVGADLSDILSSLLLHYKDNAFKSKDDPDQRLRRTSYFLILHKLLQKHFSFVLTESGIIIPGHEPIFLRRGQLVFSLAENENGFKVHISLIQEQLPNAEDIVPYQKIGGEIIQTLWNIRSSALQEEFSQLLELENDIRTLKNGPPEEMPLVATSIATKHQISIVIPPWTPHADSLKLWPESVLAHLQNQAKDWNHVFTQKDQALKKMNPHSFDLDLHLVRPY